MVVKKIKKIKIVLNSKKNLSTREDTAYGRIKKKKKKKEKKTYQKKKGGGGGEIERKKERKKPPHTHLFSKGMNGKKTVTITKTHNTWSKVMCYRLDTSGVVVSLVLFTC